VDGIKQCLKCYPCARIQALSPLTDSSVNNLLLQFQGSISHTEFIHVITTFQIL